jgi:hypothetical protein
MGDIGELLARLQHAANAIFDRTRAVSNMRRIYLAPMPLHMQKNGWQSFDALLFGLYAYREGLTPLEADLRSSEGNALRTPKFFDPWAPYDLKPMNDVLLVSAPDALFTTHKDGLLACQAPVLHELLQYARQGALYTNRAPILDIRTHKHTEEQVPVRGATRMFRFRDD